MQLLHTQDCPTISQDSVLLQLLTTCKTLGQLRTTRKTLEYAFNALKPTSTVDSAYKLLYYQLHTTYKTLGESL